MSIAAFKEGFTNPDRRYGVYKIVHGGVVSPEAVENIDRCGFAGVVGNAPYSLAFPNNAEEWEKTENGFRNYISKGMHTWIYDEKGYPSGTAGGYVTEAHPEFIAKGLYCYDYWRRISGPSVYRADVPGDKLWKAVLIPTRGGDPIDVTDCLNKNNVLYAEVPQGEFYLFMMSIRRLFDGTHATESYSEPRNYISMSDKKATEAFIESTHENYRRILGDEFGKGVLAMFTDEPSLISWNIRNGVFPILPWLDSYPEDFEKKYGYNFMFACVAVVTGKGENPVKRRCDFWEFIADTVADGFFGTIQDWCHKNGIKASGHMLREERLQDHVYNYGSFYRSMKRFDWPGIDQLQTEPSSLMYSHSIPIARFIASFADISGERESFTEFSDHCVRERGEIAGKELYYASVNWHLAMGINNFTSYYSYSGFSDEDCRNFNIYTARCGYLLRQGIRDSRTAVFYPEAAMWAAYTPSTNRNSVDSSERTHFLDEAFASSGWELLHRQCDFDYIDCALLIDGKIENGALVYRDRSYTSVIVPDAFVIEDKAAEKLITLAENGVKVFFYAGLPSDSRETGEKSLYAEKIRELIIARKAFFAEAGNLRTLIDAELSDRALTLIPECGQNASEILSHARITEDGTRIVFLTNMSGNGFSGELRVNGDFSKAYTADPATGAVFSDCALSRRNGNSSVRVTVEPGKGVFYIFE